MHAAFLEEPTSTRVIEVSRDIVGLEIAARELLEEELHAPDDDRIRKSAEKAANREAVMKSLRERRTLSPGYYVRAQYLFKLDSTMDVVQFGASDLMASEVEGVRMIRRVKQKFQIDHPDCPKCGALQLHAGVRACRKCQFKLREAS